MHKRKVVGSFFYYSAENGRKYKRILRYFSMLKILHFLGSKMFKKGVPSPWATDAQQYLETKLLQR